MADGMEKWVRELYSEELDGSHSTSRTREQNE